jgi:magnesium transporter
VTYYSSAEPSTIHARSISEIPGYNNESLTDMMQKGCFWIDIHNPTDNEMKALCKSFRIHPLTAEDISMEEQREKCEVFMNYYFICFRSFDQDEFSPNYMQPSAIYIIVFKEGVLTVSCCIFVSQLS